MNLSLFISFFLIWDFLIRTLVITAAVAIFVVILVSSGFAFFRGDIEFFSLLFMVLTNEINSDRGLRAPDVKNNHTNEDEGFRLPAGVRPVHYSVDLDVDLVARWHSGEARSSQSFQ